MAAEITYWSAAAPGKAVPGAPISSEERTTSGSSAQSAATPANADLVSVFAITAAIRILYASNPTATADGASVYIGLGERLWFQAVSGYKIAAINA